MNKTNKAIATALIIGLTGAAMPANAAPELRFSRLDLNISSERCVNQAYQILENQEFDKLRKNTPDRNGYFYAIGYGKFTKVIVDCSRLSGQRTQATIMVAGESNQPEKEVSMLIGIITKALSGDTTQTPDKNNRFLYRNRPMDADTFVSFIKALESSWPHQMQFLSQPLREAYFTSDQVCQVIRIFPFPREQENVAVMFYPRVVDKSNWFVVYDAFTFPSTRDAVMRRINN
ncbi:MAG TPA: DUF4476 domain-containing protein [Oculatellaceae cyanobacterium]|jgi:hypothetical protein